MDVVEVGDVAVAGDAEMMTILGDPAFHRSFSFDLSSDFFKIIKY